MKQYYIINPGCPQEGPFDEQFIREQYAAGAYEEGTHIWTEGMNDWLPIATVFPSVKLQKELSTPPPFTRKTSPPSLTTQDNREEHIQRCSQTTYKRQRREKKKNSMGCLLGAIIGTILIIFTIFCMFSRFEWDNAGKILTRVGFMVAGCYYMWKEVLRK